MINLKNFANHLILKKDLALPRVAIDLNYLINQLGSQKNLILLNQIIEDCLMTIGSTMMKILKK